MLLLSLPYFPKTHIPFKVNRANRKETLLNKYNLPLTVDTLDQVDMCHDDNSCDLIQSISPNSFIKAHPKQ